MTYTIRNYRNDRKHPYAWPGGYSRFFVMEDGEPMCHACGVDAWRVVISNWTGHVGWRPVACDINWEDADMVCCNCNKPIQSAYGEK